MRRYNEQRPHYLGDLELALNVNGNQRIARLQASLIDPEQLSISSTTPAKPSEKDDRVPTSRLVQVNLQAEDGEREAQSFDLNFFPSGPPSQPRFNNLALTPAHTFGQVETYRANLDDMPQLISEEAGEDEDESAARKRRRITGLPVQITSKIPFEYPILPTFPPIFSFVSAGSPERIPAKSVAVKSSLSTTTAVATRIKELRIVVGSTVGVVDDREGLVHELEELVEQYQEGWEDDGESDDE